MITGKGIVCNIEKKFGKQGLECSETVNSRIEKHSLISHKLVVWI
jgi:hypothetical protein